MSDSNAFSFNSNDLRLNQHYSFHSVLTGNILNGRFRIRSIPVIVGAKVESPYSGPSRPALVRILVYRWRFRPNVTSDFPTIKNIVQFPRIFSCFNNSTRIWGIFLCKGLIRIGILRCRRHKKQRTDDKQVGVNWLRSLRNGDWGTPEKSRPRWSDVGSRPVKPSKAVRWIVRACNSM